jgi:hypothetical protein
MSIFKLILLSSHLLQSSLRRIVSSFLAAYVGSSSAHFSLLRLEPLGKLVDGSLTELRY